MKKLIIGTASLALTVLSPAIAQASDILDGISVSTSIDYASEYVFRGVSFQRGSVQPGIELSKGNFTLGAWSAVGLGETSSGAIDEFDLYGSYGQDLTDLVSGSVGFTVFHFPDTPGGLFDFGGASTFEVNAGLALNTVLSPSITGYYDFDLDAFTLEGGVSHSFPVADKTSLDLGVTGGFVTSDQFTNYEYGLGTAALSYAFSDNVSAYIGANYSINSEDSLRFGLDGNGNGFTRDDTLFWYGTGVSTSF